MTNRDATILVIDDERAIRDMVVMALEKEGFTPEEIEEGLTIFGPSGCKQCNSGYRGRVGIFQVMEVSEMMGRIIMEGGNAIMIADQAEKEGLLVGISAVVIGVCALGVSLYEASLMREEQRAAVIPILELARSYNASADDPTKVSGSAVP